MLVSICTVTFNRRPFIPSMIQCVQHQNYTGPMEWIIVDDGTDPIGDLVSHLPNVKYIRLETKHTLGKKRNIMHSYATGDILVYMDDDDYYPKERVSHAVEQLTSSTALCAGSSILHIYFEHIDKIIEFGPYGPNHATAGTFALKRELLSQTSYDESASMAEEKHFLKNYTIPFVQLDPKKTILVVSHAHNTFDKKKLLDNPNKFIQETTFNMGDFIKEPLLYTFFKYDIHVAVQRYDLGMPFNKPDVMEHLKKMERKPFSVKIGDRILYEEEIVDFLNYQQRRIADLENKNKLQHRTILTLMSNIE
jgi:glycosyltransferase involved in cell wall biosynthesis